MQGLQKQGLCFNGILTINKSLDFEKNTIEVLQNVTSNYIKLHYWQHDIFYILLIYAILSNNAIDNVIIYCLPTLLESVWVVSSDC